MLRVWIEAPEAHHAAACAWLTAVPGTELAVSVLAADAVIFVVNAEAAAHPRFQTASDYVLTTPRFKDRVLTLLVDGKVDNVPWILRRLEFYDVRYDANVSALIKQWVRITDLPADADLAQHADAVIPYVLATLSAGSRVTTSHPEWVAVHAGRVRSSINQLEGLHRLAKAKLKAEPDAAGVGQAPNPRANLPPGQRRAQVARRKQATRRR